MAYHTVKITFDFFKKYYSNFNAKMALYFFAKFQKTEDKACFSLEEARAFLNYSPKHIMLAYNECLDEGLFKELDRVGMWVTIEIIG